MRQAYNYLERVQLYLLVPFRQLVGCDQNIPRVNTALSFCFQVGTLEIMGALSCCCCAVVPVCSIYSIDVVLDCSIL